MSQEDRSGVAPSRWRACGSDQRTVSKQAWRGQVEDRRINKCAEARTSEAEREMPGSAGGGRALGCLMCCVGSCPCVGLRVQMCRGRTGERLGVEETLRHVV